MLMGENKTPHETKTRPPNLFLKIVLYTTFCKYSISCKIPLMVCVVNINLDISRFLLCMCAEKVDSQESVKNNFATLERIIFNQKLYK